jgi:hypothetical protein
VDGFPEMAVTVRDAARLLGVGLEVMEKAVNAGKVEVALAPDGVVWVLVESLWGLVPEEGR